MLSAVADPSTTFNLARAVITASATPVLLLDGDLVVYAASASFAKSFGVRAAIGRPLASLGAGAWDKPELRHLLRLAAAGKAPVGGFEMALEGADAAPRPLTLTVQKLPDPDPAAAWLLVTVADGVDLQQRLDRAEELVREKTILLQEVQHRTANSLQIIASLLLQGARKVEQHEARTELEGAHGRVMSIAAVQSQLAASTLSEVALKPYLDELCAGLAKALINDPKRLSLHLDCEPVMVSARASTSLGLIITESVVNAIKHAFPDGRSGAITIAYATQGQAWTLSVSDDGVGSPQGGGEVTVGLGTGIVQALASQLMATVERIELHPGLSVRIAHDAAAA